jgi:hypothetical protein
MLITYLFGEGEENRGYGNRHRLGLRGVASCGRMLLEVRSLWTCLLFEVL